MLLIDKKRKTMMTSLLKYNVLTLFSIIKFPQPQKKGLNGLHLKYKIETLWNKKEAKEYLSSCSSL